MTFQNQYEGERAISELIKKDNNCSAHFNYSFVEGACLNLVTYNPTSNAFFLVHTTKGLSKLEVITKMYDYLYTLKQALETKEDVLLNYTIHWFNKILQKEFKSYFYGKNISHVLRKFHYGKTEESYIIYNIKLNPKS